ncbi:cysteine desulfurase [Clostridium sp. CAG:632]|jgi:cysteine desulfurase|nr:cysteine desulfurase [Clostridium sp.]CCY58620.1 cysteine desulfurase [Clostridium sp. CAG:632]
MEAYFDNAATTRVAPEVQDIVKKVMDLDYGNPSSRHRKGAEAEKYIKEAQDIIAGTLKAEPKEIIFTSGGTESNNMALIGAAFANRRRGNHIISTRIEHASVYNPLLFLEEQGFRITFLNVDRQGHVDPEELKQAICPETILVSVMMVNNEIGAIEPIEEIGKIIKKANPDIVFHVDAIQAYGKLKISVKRCKIDLLSVSGHKIHGPKGTGFLYVRDKVKLRPIIYGGGQQRDFRSGTENVPGIAGLGMAAKLIYTNHAEKIEKIRQVKDTFLTGVRKLDGVVDNSGEAPHIASVSFRGIERSEVLLHALEAKGVYCSSGSACSSNHPAISGTLKAIGVEDELLNATLRFSFSVYSSVEEAEYAVQVLAEELPKRREFVKR